jgi:hypothetical protein
VKKLVVVFLLVVGAGLAWTFAMKKDVESRYDLALLQDIANGANKTLPVMVDEITRLEKVSASDDLLEKHYTLVNTNVSNLNVADINNQLSKILTELSCGNAQSIKLYKNGVSEWFSYKDGNGNHITTVKINASNCQK